MEEAPFQDRAHAGAVLAERLAPLLDPGTVILAVPNGGAAVAAPIAQRFGLPLYLLIVRKIQLPWNTEAGFGAVGTDESVILNEELVRELNLTETQIRTQTEKALRSVRERLSRYGAAGSWPDPTDRTLLLVDDGLASGVTMESAVRLASRRKPARILVAAPTASRTAYHRIRPLVDQLVCPHVAGGPIFAVADAYREWKDLEDAEVIQILQSLRDRTAS